MDTSQPGNDEGVGWDPRDRFTGHPIRPEPPVFKEVSERDLVTLADLVCRSLEFHSMLVATKVMSEVHARHLWPIVIERRAYSLRLSRPEMKEDDSRRLAAEQIERFRGEHFPVEPEQFGGDPLQAAKEWNGYIAF